MTLTVNDPRDEYTATAGQTVFNYTFKIYDSTDLDVYVTPNGEDCSDSNLTTAYTVAGVGNEGGGSITLNSATSAGDLVTIVSSIPANRTTDYQNNGDFRPETVNDDFDRILSIVKQVKDKADRSLQFSDCLQGVTSLSLPAPEASKYLRWNDDLSGVENAETPQVTVTDANILSVSDYLTLRALDTSTLVDGQELTVTNSGIFGSGAIRNVVSHGLSDNGGTVIVIDSDWYWERDYNGGLNPDWFGAAPGGVIDATAAFNSAISVGSVLFTGTYLVNDITVVSGMVVKGTDRTNSVLQTGTNNGSIFLHSSSGDISRPNLANFTAKTATGSVTGARFWKQNNKSIYTAYPLFENIETYKEFEVSYDGYFIFAEWEKCRDGFSGSSVGGQTHQAISSIPAAFGQGRQTNLNRVVGCEFFRSDHSEAAIDIAYGVNWQFVNNDWEQCDTRAIRARGIYGLNIEANNWFEAVRADELVLATISPAPNAQGSRPTVFKGNHCFLDETNLRVLNIGSASQASVMENTFASVPSGIPLANITSFNEFYGNQAISGAGAATLFDGITSSRKSMEISDSEMTSEVINSPQSSNQNIFPLGPTGLGSTNFTEVGFFGKTDVSSALGLSGQAIQVTASGSANALYYTVTTKLRDWLEGKKVTIVVMGWGDSTGGATALKAAVWEDVTPTGSNQTASGGSISTSNENLQTAYVTHTIGSGLTSLHFGIRAGGVASTPDVKIEAFSVYLGEIKPEGISFT